MSGSTMLLLIISCHLLGSILAKPLPDFVLAPRTYRLTHPTYPKNYTNMAKIKYVLRGSEGQEITIKCDEYDLEYERHCDYDYLEINGHRYCGNGSVPVIKSTQFNIVFKFDYSVTATGFICFIVVPPYVTTVGTTKGTTVGTTEGTREGLTKARDKRCCGIANRVSRVVDGEQKEVNEYPWQVGIVIYGMNGPECGGTVINNQWVLSAAHCAPDYLSADIIQVLLRKYNFYSDPDQIRMNVAQIVNHPSYNPDNKTHDFTLLKLSSPIDFRSFNNKVEPACLPTEGDFANLDAVVSGWGLHNSEGTRPSVLQEVTVETMTNAECSSGLKGTVNIDSSMLCADVKAGGGDSCQGDGGPLVTQVGGRYTLIGVISSGLGCGERGMPGVFSRVTAVADWIRDTTSGSELC